MITHLIFCICLQSSLGIRMLPAIKMHPSKGKKEGSHSNRRHDEPPLKLPSVFKKQSGSDPSSCSHVLYFVPNKDANGYVDCTYGKELTGGMQASTNFVTITINDEHRNLPLVLKETSHPHSIDSMRNERRVVDRLMTPTLNSPQGFVHMPKYYTGFHDRQRGSELLVMQRLDGYHDLSRKTINAGIFGDQNENAYTREVRVAAFILALDELYQAKYAHCDLNEGNVMFKREDPTTVKLIDFGLSQRSHIPGSCRGDGMPDLGSDGGAAFNIIYSTMVFAQKQREDHTRGVSLSQRKTILVQGRQIPTISSACGSTPCNTQMYWTRIVQQAQVLVDSYRQQ